MQGIWYEATPVKGLFDPQRGHDPCVENHCFRSHLWANLRFLVHSLQTCGSTASSNLQSLSSLVFLIPWCRFMLHGVYFPQSCCLGSSIMSLIQPRWLKLGDLNIIASTKSAMYDNGWPLSSTPVPPWVSYSLGVFSPDHLPVNHFRWLFSILWSSFHPSMPPGLFCSFFFWAPWPSPHCWLPRSSRLSGGVDPHYLCTFLLGCLAKYLKLKSSQNHYLPTQPVLHATFPPLALCSQRSRHPLFPLFMLKQFSNLIHVPSITALYVAIVFRPASVPYVGALTV